MNNKGGKQATFARWADRLEAVLLDKPEGMTFAQISAAMGLAGSTARKAIAASAARGGVLSLRVPTMESVWWHKDNAARLHARTAQMRRDRLDRGAARSRQKYWDRNEPIEDAHESEKPFVHRWVSAHSARPLRPSGPSSVWGLAA